MKSGDILRLYDELSGGDGRVSINGCSYRAISGAITDGEITLSLSGCLAQEWNGTCLPPVGTVCEWEHEANKGNWHKAEIKYLGSTYVIVADFAGIEQHYYLRSMQFRPIRTTEQIAADEREAAIRHMTKLAHEATGMLPNRADFAALYDAGYRKQSTKQDGE